MIDNPLGQDRTGQDRQNRTGQDKTRQDRIGQNGTERDRQDRTGQNRMRMRRGYGLSLTVCTGLDWTGVEDIRTLQSKANDCTVVLHSAALHTHCTAPNIALLFPSSMKCFISPRRRSATLGLSCSVILCTVQRGSSRARTGQRHHHRFWLLGTRVLVPSL